jgi:hypothetical protein
LRISFELALRIVTLPAQQSRERPMKSKLFDAIGAQEPGKVLGRCLCGSVVIEIDYPAFWAWHDHSHASRLAHGAAYVTYVGSWRKRFRVAQGVGQITRYEDKSAGTTRAFCKRCGTPVYYERKRTPHMVNVPRALFGSRTGRHPLYHAHIEEMPDWTYSGGRLVPLKGYPGYVWERPQRRKSAPR